jgi:DNA repair exonuclease SbcCD nuclease subunit
VPPRIAFTADSQIDERHRLEEHDRVMHFIADDAQARGCGLTLHGGDIYERRSTERERNAVREWVERMASVGDVVICGGNHEAVGEVEEIALSADPGTGLVCADETPHVREVGEDAGRCLVATLPWPRRENLRAWLAAQDVEMGPADASATAVEMLRDILRGFALEFDLLDPAGTLPRILLCHVEIAGYVSDSDQPAVGSGMAVSVEDLMLACADVVLCGHIHRPQHWIGTRADGVQVPVIYAGSPRRTAFAAGELIEKGYVVVEFDGRTPRWTRVPTPATPLLLIEGYYHEPQQGEDYDAVFSLRHRPHDVKGAEIRLRYETPADMREFCAREADEWAKGWLEEGAIEVKVEPVILPTTRARAPEVAAAVGVEQQLRAMWTTQDVPAARQDTLAQIARQIEESVR